MIDHLEREQIVQGLQALGLTEGDIVLLHSSLSSFGRVETGAQTVVDAFLAVLGERGTLVVPTFGALGIITDVVKAHPRVVRSIHPIASVAAIGAHAEAICKDHWKAETAHGKDTPYTRIADLGGYICLAGVDQDRSTTLHTVEALLELPYLSDRTKTFQTEEGEVTQTWRFFPGPHREFIGLDRMLREKGLMRFGRIGNSVIRLMKSRDVIDACLEAGRADPSFVLCKNPNCADCVKQRAAIRRDRFSKETFALAASSGLAGCYVPEIIDNLKTVGINRIELDYLEKQPFHRLARKKTQRAIREFREERIEVSSLRCWTVPESVPDWLDLAVENRIPRFVLPLSSESEAHANFAMERGLTLSLFNTVQGSSMASQAMIMLNQATSIGFTFNAANFARAGETPFLYSFKQKIHRFLDQLDVGDACFDGSVQPLANGNAEIKEMISILRCSSFEGLFVLTTPNRETGNLRSVVERFEHLLDGI